MDSPAAKIFPSPSRAKEKMASVVDPGVVVVYPEEPKVVSRTPALVYRASKNLYGPVVKPPTIIRPELSITRAFKIPPYGLAAETEFFTTPFVPKVVSRTPPVVNLINTML